MGAPCIAGRQPGPLP